MNTTTDTTTDRSATQLGILAAAPSTPPVPGLPQGIRRVNMQSITILEAIGSPIAAAIFDQAISPAEFHMPDITVFCWLHAAPAKDVAATFAYTDTPKQAILAAALEWAAEKGPEVIPAVTAAIAREQKDCTAATTVPIKEHDSKNA